MRPIVVVEDNPDDERLFLNAIRRYNEDIPVKVFRDGKDALLMFREEELPRQSEESLPGVIFLDVKLPFCSGIDILREIRQAPRLQCLPVVMFSSSNDPRDVRDSYLEGANSFLQKPSNFERYRLLVHEACQYWLESNLVAESPPS